MNSAGNSLQNIYHPTSLHMRSKILHLDLHRKPELNKIPMNQTLWPNLSKKCKRIPTFFPNRSLPKLSLQHEWKKWEGLYNQLIWRLLHLKGYGDTTTKRHYVRTRVNPTYCKELVDLIFSGWKIHFLTLHGLCTASTRPLTEYAPSGGRIWAGSPHLELGAGFRRNRGWITRHIRACPWGPGFGNNGQGNVW